MKLKDKKEITYSEYVGKVNETNRPSGGIKTVQKCCVNAFINEKKKVLEIGCNTGFTSLNIAQLTGASVLGIDLIEDSLSEARKKAKENKINNVKFEKASATKLPYKNESFDVVWLSNVLSFIEDKKNALRECIRVLKKGGFLIFVPIYYKKKVPKKIVKEVGKAINSELNILKKKDWIDFIKKNEDNLEIIFEEDSEYIDASDNIEKYLREVFKKDSLKKEDNSLLIEKGRYFMKLFNKNLKHAGFSIFILQKRNYLEEIELFLSRPIKGNK